MGVEYSLTEVRISDRKTLAADSYYMVHSRFDLHHRMAIFDKSIPRGGARYKKMGGAAMCRCHQTRIY